MALIEVRGLSKDYRVSKRGRGFPALVANLLAPRYENKRAVDNISFSIEAGEALGFIGPNGAGKSTTVKILSGILHPSSGSVTVGGLVPWRQRKEHVKRIGVVFGQKSQLWWDLPVSESFRMLRHIYDVPKARYDENLKLLDRLLGLGEFMAQPVRQLSLGQRMKADLGAALLHDPPLLFLDEPTIGLDVVAKENVRSFLNELNSERGTTLLFTTHDMKDVEKTCRRMLIIDKGTTLYDGSIDGIRERYGKERSLIVDFASESGLAQATAAPLARVSIESEGPRRARFTFQSDQVAVQELIRALNERCAISDLAIRETEIESIIREIYLKGMRP